MAPRLSGPPLFPITFYKSVRDFYERAANFIFEFSESLREVICANNYN